jgi:hypothetical protein
MLFLRTQKRYQPADGNSRSWAGDGLGMACGTTGMAISLTLLRTAPTHRPCPVRTAPVRTACSERRRGEYWSCAGGERGWGVPRPSNQPKDNSKKKQKKNHPSRPPRPTAIHTENHSVPKPYTQDAPPVPCGVARRGVASMSRRRRDRRCAASP